MATKKSKKWKAKKLEVPISRAQVKKLLTLGGRKTSKEEVDRFILGMEAGTPVMPVSFFCTFLKEWAALYGRPREGADPEENGRRKEISEKAGYVFIQIMKSNFLWRRIYRGEPTRTKPCPTHKGHWSGCKLPEDTECRGACMNAGNVTGWLP